MNTTTRTFLATAAAGALLLGSAGAATAKGSVGHNHRHVAAAAVTLQAVDIHRHSPINVNSLDTARDLKIRLVVRDTTDAKPTGAVVTLEQYTSKRASDPVVSTVTLTADDFTVVASKRNTTFLLRGAVPEADLVALGQGEPPVLPVDSDPIRVCVSDVALLTGDPATELAYTKSSMQTRKRLGDDVRHPVRECVALYNAAPTTD